MELIWSNDGVSSEENRNFLQGKPHVDRVENQGREKKIPTPPRIHEAVGGIYYYRFGTKFSDNCPTT